MKNIASNISYVILLLFFSCKGELKNDSFDANPSPISTEEESFIIENEFIEEASDNSQAGGENSIKEKAPSKSNQKVQKEIESVLTPLKQQSKQVEKQTIAAFTPLKNNSEPVELEIELMNTKEIYTPGKKQTLSLEVEIKKGQADSLFIQAKMPENWSLISSSTLENIQSGNKKLALISLYIPKNASPGQNTFTVLVIDANGRLIKEKEINIEIAENYELEVFNISSPQSVKAGEEIEAIYGIRNNGNMVQELILDSNGKINEEEFLIIAPDSLMTIQVSKKTEAKVYYLMNVSTYLNVKSTAEDKSYRAYSSTTVFPSKIKEKDAFFRFPVRASLNYNSHTFKKNHFSTISAELRGDGYLDLAKNHHLNFIFRAPQQQNLKRFGVTDQYSLIYNYKDQTTVYLGDHAYFINRLGFDSRYGMGFRIDQKYKDWLFTAYYSNPRLYSFNSAPLYGVKSVYRVNDSLFIGASLAASKGTLQGASHQIEANPDEKGQIATVNLDYRNHGTIIEAEFSGSFTNKASDFAGFLNLVQNFGNLTYSGTFSISGEDYFGAMRNSLQYSNSFFYKLNKWNFATGQTVSKVNRNLDPLFYAAEPYYENFYGLIGYRFNKKHFVSVRGDMRQREDQLEPKSYFYKEHGLLYRYLYSGERFHFNFNGRIAKTRNLLLEENIYRNSFSHNINGSYRLIDGITIRAGVNHNYNNRYGRSGNSTNYTRYHLGFNYNLNRNIRINATYNSGFSPDDSYLRRDFINSNILLRLNKNHQFELRANYYENAGVLNRKELLALGKYTYTFGVPLKRVLEQGSVEGVIFSENPAISVENIKIIAAGHKIATDKKGRFEINNLPLGKNYLFIEEASLPEGVVVSKKAPLEIIIRKDKTQNLSFELVQGGKVNGSIQLIKRKDTLGYQGYIKLTNEEFSYFVESNTNGLFSFKNIVPGNYNLDLVRFKEEDYESMESTQVNVKSGSIATILIPLTARERKIKFSKKNFTLGK
ncbi:hypothetical protein RM553_14050 [Zunongwangia sp. F363]|uniref:Uncharacterized protein n=1 Tax=Autumnicola tepida TaxID=3075595 RepID=A0ABU3CC86_9FLAO|nr:hypothetical protein [Zunongwangia sp. F363]MDT0643956.1 hypothetical protein [Zunongwangia sp. F363]